MRWIDRMLLDLLILLTLFFSVALGLNKLGMNPVLAIVLSAVLIGGAMATYLFVTEGKDLT